MELSIFRDDKYIQFEKCGTFYNISIMNSKEKLDESINFLHTSYDSFQMYISKTTKMKNADFVIDIYTRSSRFTGSSHLSDNIGFKIKKRINIRKPDVLKNFTLVRMSERYLKNAIKFWEANED